MSIPRYFVGETVMTKGRVELYLGVAYDEGDRDAHGASESFRNYLWCERAHGRSNRAKELRRIMGAIVETANRDMKIAFGEGRRAGQRRKKLE